MLREQARTECMKEDSDYESKMTAAELHEVLRNVIDSVQKACPGAQSPVGLQEAVSVARATLLQGQATARTRKPDAGPQDEQGLQAQEDREPEDGRGQQQGRRRRQRWIHDLGGRGDARKGQNIRANKPSKLAMMTGEDFERHLFGTLRPHAYTPSPSKSKDRGKVSDTQRQQREA